MTTDPEDGLVTYHGPGADAVASIATFVPAGDKAPTSMTIEHGKVYKVLRRVPIIPEGHVTISTEMLAFLHGAAPLEGVWYSEKHPNENGSYWWRRRLPQLKTEIPSA